MPPVTTVAAEVPVGVPLTVAVPELPAPGVSLGSMATDGRIAWGLVLDGLTSIGADGSPQPALATSWAAVDDTTWRFQLRTGVSFQDGTTLDGETVAASLRVALDSLRQGPDPLARVARAINEVSALEGAVEIGTRGPQPLVPALLASAYIVAPSSLEGVGSADEAPLGTGPYQVAVWRGRRIQLVRWSGSWRGNPGYDPVVLAVVPSAAARADALLQGEAQVALGLPEDPVPSGNGVTTSAVGTGEVLSITFVDGSGPTDSPLVRRAMNLAVDKDAISYSLRGDLEAAALWAPRAWSDIDPERIPWGFDPERAVDLLAQAGYPDGFNFTMEVVEGRVAGDGDVYAAVEGYLELAGITVDRRVIDLPAWQGPTSKTPTGGVMVSHSPGAPVRWPTARCPLPLSAVALHNRWRATRTPGARCGWYGPHPTRETRQEALGTVLDATAEDPPALFLTEPIDVWGWRQFG